jgi:outer membrane protein TolC
MTWASMQPGKWICSVAPAGPFEAASAEASAVEADLADTQVQLSAEVAQAYVDLRDQQQRIALVRDSAELEEQILTLTEQRRAQGVASDLDVERIRTQVENTRGTLIPLDAQITESLDQLATLTGREPGALDAELDASGCCRHAAGNCRGWRPRRAVSTAS